MPGLVIVFFNGNALASSQEIDALSGVRQDFTSDYSARVFGDQFHSASLQRTAPSAFVSPKSRVPVRWRLRGGVQVGATYDSNVGTTPRTPQDDVTILTSGSLGLIRRDQKTYLATFYNIAYSSNIEFTESNKVNHLISSQLRFKFNRLKLEVDNTLIPASDFAVGERTELSTDGRQKVLTWQDALITTATYSVSQKTEVSLKASYKLLYFPVIGNSEEVNSFSSHTYQLNPRFTYKITPKTDVHADYVWAQEYVWSDGGRGEETNVYSVGMGTRLSSKMGIGFDVGLKYRYPRNTDILPSEHDPIVSVAIFRKLTSKIGLSVFHTQELERDYNTALGRFLEEVTRTYGTNLTWVVSPHVNINVEGSASLRDNQDTLSLLDLDNPGLLFTRPDEDQTYQWSLLWDWHPRRYLRFLLGYKYVNKNSSFKDFEYEDHKCITSVQYFF